MSSTKAIGRSPTPISPATNFTTSSLSTTKSLGSLRTATPSQASLRPTTPSQDRTQTTPIKFRSAVSTPTQKEPPKEKDKDKAPLKSRPSVSRPTTPTSAAADAADKPTQDEILKVTAWQNDVDSLEQKQLRVQTDQMNLLHNQIHILTRELGDLQIKFVLFETNMQSVQEEAHSALRLEMAEHGSNAAEMKAAWEEAHKALSKNMDEGLASVAADHAKALEDHKAENAKALSDHADNLSNHGSNLSQLEDLHNKRYEEHSASLEAGLENVHGTLQKELAELRSGHAVNLQSVVTDVTTQVDKLTVDVEQMAQDLKAAQEEAHSALRLELAEHGNNASEMKAAWEEAHNALSKAMDDGLGNLAAEHAKALDDHKAETGKMFSDHAENLDNHGSNLSEMEELHNRRAEEHSASLERGLSDVHGSLQRELEELRSGHAVNLQKIVEDVTNQVDKLTIDVEQMAGDLKAAQEEAHSALRLELAEHGNNADEMKAAWAEAHKALTASMDDNLANLAEEHAKALEDHRTEQSQMFSDHADNLAGHGNNLSDMEDLHNKRYEEHSASLEKGLSDVHGSLQKELEELRSGHAVNLQKIVEDVTNQVDKLTLDVEDLARDVKAAQEEAHSALRLELAEHGSSAAEMKAAWEEAHNALAKAMDDGLGNLAAEHAKALDDHKADASRAMAEHGENLANNGSSLSELEDLHNQRYEEHTACLERGLEDVHGTLQKELAELRSGHSVNLQKIVEDVTNQVDKLTLDMEELVTDVKAAQEEAHSALRLELAEHGNNAAEMKAAWEEAHKALSQSMDENLSNVAAEQVKALEKHAADHAQALAEHKETHGNTVADIQRQLSGDLEAQANSVRDLAASYDAKHAEHDERYKVNTAKMEVGLQNVLENTHDRLQRELTELKSGHAANLKDILQDLTQQTDNIALSLETESELRKIMEVKLDHMFEGMRGLMSVSFLDNMADLKKAAEDKQKEATIARAEARKEAAKKDAGSEQPDSRPKSPAARGFQPSASGLSGSLVADTRGSKSPSPAARGVQQPLQPRDKSPARDKSPGPAARAGNIYQQTAARTKSPTFGRSL